MDVKPNPEIVAPWGVLRRAGIHAGDRVAAKAHGGAPRRAV
ncbi:MAG: hypothetical protein ABSF25_02415 [Bryobacteraceae bacterium]